MPNSLFAQLLNVDNDGGSFFRISPGIGCKLIGYPLVADMTVNPLYQFDGVQCKPVLPSSSGSYYADSSCTNLIGFRQTSHEDFCEEILDKYDLIDDRVVADEWVLSSGTTYDGSVATLDGLTQPYRTSVTYQSHTSDRGECRLDMRIYKNSPDSGETPLRPLIALHGGTWTSRDVGIIGIENAAARYTQKGFVVFAPFFRLLSDLESDACNEATMADILADLETALGWVENNAKHYGASGKPVLFGQSSGAQSALALSINHPQRIAGSVLFYPITDFGDFLSQIQSGEYDDFYGKIALSNVFGGDYEDVSPDEAFITENSFPAIIQSRSLRYPPMLILHGEADELVPVRQVTRLCNALAGRELDFKLYATGELYKQIYCGEDQELRLFTEAGHAMEVCISTSSLLSFSCFSGDADSQRLIAQGVESASLWAARIASEYADESTVVESSSGTGAVDTAANPIIDSGGVVAVEDASEIDEPSTDNSDSGTGSSVADTGSPGANPDGVGGAGALLLQMPGYCLIVLCALLRRTRGSVHVRY